MLRRTAQDPPFSLRRNVSRTLPTRRRGLVIAASLLMALGLVVGLVAVGTVRPVAAATAAPAGSAQAPDTTLAPASLGGSSSSTDSTSGSSGTGDSTGPEGGFVAV